MASGKVRSLYVRPVKSSDLSFDAPGVIESRTANVGDVVNKLDFASTVLNQLNPTVGSDAIRTLLAANPLATLRSPVAAATLDQMIVQRQLAYLRKYKHKTDILSAYNSTYTASPDGKLSRLNRLAQYEQQRASGVDNAYTNSGLTGVITQADTSVISYGGAQTSNVFVNSIGSRQPQHQVTVSGPVSSTNTINDTDNVPIKYTGSPPPAAYDASKWTPIYDGSPVFNSQRTETALPAQMVKTKFTDFRDLGIENKMQSENTQLNLQDQLLSQAMVNAQVPDLGDILDGELKAIDLELRKAQIGFALLNLTAPISGRITAIFKEVGESVGVGEPVMRIESQDDILLVGLIQYRSPLVVGTPISVTAREVFEDGGKGTIQGTVVAVRGHDANNDEWDVMIAAKNTGTNVTMPNGSTRSVVFPLNYHFDRETTDFTI